MKHINLKKIIQSAVEHYIIKEQPPALTENGRYGGLRVPCEQEPKLRYDPVGLVIPKEIFRGYPEGARITDLLNQSSDSVDMGLVEFFGEVPVNALQELQDIHDNIVVNDVINFSAKLLPALKDFAKRHKETDVDFGNGDEVGIANQESPSVNTLRRSREMIAILLQWVGLVEQEDSVRPLQAVSTLAIATSTFYNHKVRGTLYSPNSEQVELFKKWNSEGRPKVEEFLFENGIPGMTTIKKKKAARGSTNPKNLKLVYPEQFHFVNLAAEHFGSNIKTAAKLCGMNAGLYRRRLAEAGEINERDKELFAAWCATDSPNLEDFLAEKDCTMGPRLSEVALQKYPEVVTETAETDAPKKEVTTEVHEQKEPEVVTESAETDAPTKEVTTEVHEQKEPEVVTESEETDAPTKEVGAEVHGHQEPIVVTETEKTDAPTKEVTAEVHEHQEPEVVTETGKTDGFLSGFSKTIAKTRALEILERGDLSDRERLLLAHCHELQERNKIVTKKYKKLKKLTVSLLSDLD